MPNFDTLGPNKIMYDGTLYILRKDIGFTPPLWTDLVKNFTRRLRHASSFFLECTDFVPYESSILGQLLNPICPTKINIS